MTQFEFFFSDSSWIVLFEVVMWKAKDANPIIWMLLKLIFFLILVHKLNKYIKIVKIIKVQMLGLVEDEKTFRSVID